MTCPYAGDPWRTMGCKVFLEGRNPGAWYLKELIM